MTSPRDHPVRRTITVPAPAAGAHWSVRPTDGGVWRVRSFIGEFTSSAVAGNRHIRIMVDDGNTTYALYPPAAVQAAGSTFTYVGWPGSNVAVAVSNFVSVAWPTDGIILQPGHTLQSTSPVFDPGDQWGIVTLDVISYPDRPPYPWYPDLTPYRAIEGA